VQSRFPAGGLDVREVLRWTDEDYRAKLKGSAMRRVKLPMLKRNAQLVMRNLAGGKQVP
jgi:epoxyqueuosine reductase QueG